METKMLALLAAVLAVATADTSPHYHSSLGGLRSCQRTSGGYAVSSEPGVYRHEYVSSSVPASSSSYRVVERPVEYYSSTSSQSRPVIYESSHSSRPVIYESSQSSRPVVYESSRPVYYESSSHQSRPVIYESSSVPASRTYTTYTQYESPSQSRVYTPTQYYSSGGSTSHTRYEYPATTNVRYTSGSGSSGCTRCAKKK